MPDARVPFKISASRPLRLIGGGPGPNDEQGWASQVLIEINLEIACPSPGCGSSAPIASCPTCHGMGYKLTANGRALVALMHLYAPKED